MIDKANFKKGSHVVWSPYKQIIKSVILSTLILTGLQTTLQAQEDEYTKPSWWLGVAGGANFNFYDGTTQQLNGDLTVPAAFRHGNGVGIYVAPLVEYYRPNTRLGAMLQVGYDSRRGSFDQVTTPCNCPADLSTELSYITVEPSLRFAPFKSDFYFYGGPRMAFNVGKSFTYEQGINPDFPNQTPIADVDGDLSKMYKTLFSMQIGAGYDISLSSQNKQTQYVLSPFVAFQPYFGQAPRSIETWNLSTLRVGVALKLGRGSKSTQAVSVLETLIPRKPNVLFTVNAPKNIPAERSVRETFPLRNYIFFDLKSTEIPDRYVLLTKNQVKDFKEDQLEVFKPKRLSGRSDRQMTVYYNVLNILGDRLGKNPRAAVKLSGASMDGSDDGKAMAESVKQYLVDVFGIEASRISVEGQVKPKNASELPGGENDLTRLREGDRRVTISSESPALLMEFQSGPNVPLKPVEITGVHEAPFDSYVTFNVEGAKEAFSSWSLEIKDKKGAIQKFGPYTQETISIPGKSILGTSPQGDYRVTMIGHTKGGSILKKKASLHMALWTPTQKEEGMRYSVIYEFDESNSTALYEKYLTDIVTPKIPTGGTVILHGHTDAIGDETYNQELSKERANDVRKIIENALSKADRSDVKFEVYGFGEDQDLSPFANNFPEERFYNRTVVIDIIPAK